MTEFLGEEGYDFTQLLELGLSESPTIKNLRKKSSQLYSTTELTQKLLEYKMGGLDDPITYVDFK